MKYPNQPFLTLNSSWFLNDFDLLKETFVGVYLINRTNDKALTMTKDSVKEDWL